jgi:UDP-N-acetylmuramyl pentapeptide phosphotransferase/UDP-N-acetylglucosamine-1-phosphate transferase
LNELIYISVSLFLASFFLTFLYRKLAISHNVLDIPNERSSHLTPTPKGGGIAIVITWYFGISILFYFDFIPLNLYLALLSGIILAIISFIDDLIDIKPALRLVAQVFTAIVSLYFLKGIDPLTFGKIQISSQFILLPFAIIGIVWFINLYNFLDGIDGYASLEALTISLVLLLITCNPVCLILCASIMGFIPWNWPKARIFMGDVGSTQLGFILIVLGIYFQNQSQLSMIHWIMLSSVFWFDATLTLYRRWRNREKLSVAHKKHVYQRAVQSGFSHQRIICFSLLINSFIIGLVFASIYFKGFLIPAFALNIILLYVVTLFIDRRFPFK